jgi:hypothetical protein
MSIDAAPYAKQRAQIEALNDLAYEEACTAIRAARRLAATDHYPRLMDLFLRLKRSVERGAAYLVRLDQAQLWKPRQPANTDAPPATHADPARRDEPPLDALPQLDRFEQMVTDTVREVRAAVEGCDPDADPAEPEAASRSQAEIAREALRLKHRAAGRSARELRRVG